MGGKCCSVYEVIATKEEDTSLCLLIDELKEKDLVSSGMYERKSEGQKEREDDIEKEIVERA